ncbi:MAG TPA: energy-coupling factor transporter ATPase [Desulfobacteraceae bacterium]|nr:energy-coupling factor transporter ATPase [Desulfobacteraceae bacterium]
MIRLDSVTYSYNGTGKILSGISLEIYPGEHIAVIGPNGSGKTTLLRHMNGLLSPSSGRVTVDDFDTKNQRTLPRVRQLAGMVFQNPDNQIVGMTVEEDVAFGPGNLGLPPAEIRRRVERSLNRVGIQDLSHRTPSTLSNGEKQLVAVAGVLAMEPRYLLLDEASAYLDPAGKARISEVISELDREGITIVHVTHDMDEAARARRVIVLAHGRIIMDGPPSEIFNRADDLDGLGLAVPAAAGLAHRLRSAGVPIPSGILTMEDAEEAIKKLLAFSF